MSGQITDYLEKIIETSKELGIRIENLTKDQYDLYWSEDAVEFTGDPFSIKADEVEDTEWMKAKQIAIDLAILNRRSDKEKSELHLDPPMPTDEFDSKLFGLIKINTKQSVVVVSLYSTVVSVILSVVVLSFFSLLRGAILFDLGLLPAIVMPLIIVPPLAYFVFNQIYLLNKLSTEADALKRTDSLTGLFNKEFFTELVEMELAVASRYSFPSSLFLVDLDNFKEVNDIYGYQVGDQVLQVVAAYVKDNMRGSDLVGRFDGEQITVYLPHTTCEQALIAAERVRRMISETTNHIEQDEFAVTASIGVCATEFGYDTFDRLIKGAESAVQDAKYGGRNRVEHLTMTWVDKEPPSKST